MVLVLIPQLCKLWGEGLHFNIFAIRKKTISTVISAFLLFVELRFDMDGGFSNCVSEQA